MNKPRLICKCYEYTIFIGKRRVQMKANATILAKNRISVFMGRRVKLKAIGDRNRVTMLTGVVDGIYPSLFTVTQAKADGPKKRCFSYTDIITRRLFIKEEAEKESSV